MKKNDFMLAIIVLLIAVLIYVFIPKEQGNFAKIMVDGKLYSTVSLDTDTKIEINGTNIAVVENGEIYMTGDVFYVGSIRLSSEFDEMLRCK